MSSPNQGSLPKLAVGDFGPGQDHLAEVYHQGKILALVHKDDPVRKILPNLRLVHDDPFTYVFIHGGEEVTRFENLRTGTHEIPAPVVAQLLAGEYGGKLVGMSVRMCTCYGTLLRPGDIHSAVQRLAACLPGTSFEGYRGLVRVFTTPAEIRLGSMVEWDQQLGSAVVIGPPGNWESVTP